MSEVSYAPGGPVIKGWHEDESFVRGLMGPIGSGKSTACVVEILRRGGLQRPGADGVGRSRWAVIRNSYPELKTTTLKTWDQWAPTSVGRFVQDSPIVHHIQTDELDLELLFLALDRDEDVRKLMSLELTGAWINEAREVPKSILDALTGRVGRYPPIRDGGPTWSGIIMDTNPPDQDSWWYRLAEDSPEGYAFFRQPSGVSDEAENIPNLPKDYYLRAASGKDADWIKRYVDGEYVYLQEGMPVFPQFRDRTHVAEVDAVEDLPLLIGVDFGLTPAAVIGQRMPNGRWLIIDELVTENTGVIRFAEMLNQLMAEKYPKFEGEGWGDPAGNARSQTDERSCFEILEHNTPWIWMPAPTNDTTLRLEAVRAPLNRLVDGDSGIVISPRCAMLRKALNGGFRFARVGGSATRYHEKPLKNEFSHVADALQYLLLGGGEHYVVLGHDGKEDKDVQKFALDDEPFDKYNEPHVEPDHYDPFNRLQREYKRPVQEYAK